MVPPYRSLNRILASSLLRARDDMGTHYDFTPRLALVEEKGLRTPPALGNGKRALPSCVYTSGNPINTRTFRRTRPVRYTFTMTVMGNTADHVNAIHEQLYRVSSLVSVNLNLDVIEEDKNSENPTSSYFWRLFSLSLPARRQNITVPEEGENYDVTFDGDRILFNGDNIVFFGR